jgi:hypothetical protein
MNSVIFWAVNVGAIAFLLLQETVLGWWAHGVAVLNTSAIIGGAFVAGKALQRIGALEDGQARIEQRLNVIDGDIKNIYKLMLRKGE